MSKSNLNIRFYLRTNHVNKDGTCAIMVRFILARYCKHIGFPDSFTKRIISQQSVPLKGALYSPEHSQIFSAEHSEAKLERDPKERHRFILTIDGVSVFQ